MYSFFCYRLGIWWILKKIKNIKVIRDMADFENDKKYKGYMLIYVLINGIIIYMLVIKILIIVFF